MTLAPWIRGVFATFCIKSSLPSFLHCSSTSYRCSFVISFYLALAWFLISALNLRYFSNSCSTWQNSVGEISPSCIACEIILAMLSNLSWANSLIASCFFCFTMKILKNFRVIAVARKGVGQFHSRQYQQAIQHHWQKLRQKFLK